MDSPKIIQVDAPYPPDTRAKGYRFELDYERIIQSDTWALASPLQRPLLLMLWFVAWQQTPCGSLPDSGELISARIGIDTSEFEQNRAILLRGWNKADDGRLYHPVVSEMVLEMLTRKARETQRKADYRERMKSQNVPPLSLGTDSGQTRESGGSDDTGTGTGTSKRKPFCSPSASESSNDRFDEFWSAYDKKVGKSNSLKEWAKIKPNADLVRLIVSAAKVYSSSKEQQFRKDPERWLKGRMWQDEGMASTSAAGPDWMAGAL